MSEGMIRSRGHVFEKFRYILYIIHYPSSQEMIDLKLLRERKVTSSGEKNPKDSLFKRPAHIK